ncbi:MAG: septal ring lytic transglycosylase RlpA family protein [Chromatiales bacterium]|nr:MAG: septal ring lytic transglycosylase RlpA family protein [Chromatiales bacterium]
MRWWALLLLAAALGACSKASRWEEPTRSTVSKAPSPVIDEPGQPPRSKRGNPAFYEVFGNRYYVLASSADYREKGVASWYGKKFHGRLTSSGVRYDMHAMTAAHKTLPLPTRVRVTNLKNQRSVIVTVNDRGPFVHNRLIDMSYAAAQQLGMIRDGTAMVSVEALPFDAPPAVAAKPPRIPSMVATASAAPPPAEPVLYLQVGAFGDAGNAERLKSQLETGGFQNVRIRQDMAANKALYRVRLGPIADVAEYDQLIERVAALNINDAMLVTERPGG